VTPATTSGVEKPRQVPPAVHSVPTTQISRHRFGIPSTLVQSDRGPQSAGLAHSDPKPPGPAGTQFVSNTPPEVCVIKQLVPTKHGEPTERGSHTLGSGWRHAETPELTVRVAPVEVSVT
jgi:hypothetical protein